MDEQKPHALGVGSNALLGELSWTPLSALSKPRAGVAVVVLYDGELHCGRTRIENWHGDEGLWIDCENAGIWNVDKDEQDKLPTHFCELPPLPPNSELDPKNEA